MAEDAKALIELATRRFLEEVPALDARVRVDMRREFFNVMAREARVPDWIEAFTYGQAKASGPDQFIKLIVNVVERQQERQRTRKARRPV